MTTINTVTAPHLSDTLGLLMTLTLLALLIFRQFAVMLPGEQTRRWGRTLTIPIVPLLISFAIVAMARGVITPPPPNAGMSAATPSPTLLPALPATPTPDSPATTTTPVPTPTPLPPTAVPTATATATARPTAGAAPPPAPSPTPGGVTGELLYASNKDGRWAIYSLRADGTGERRLTDPAANNYNGVWSPDGRTIAFVSERDGNQEVYLMGADGSGQRRLTNAPGADEAPAWSPDGSSLAFVSDREGGVRAIYFMDREGGNLLRIIDAPAERPAWSRAGTLAFVRPVSGASAIFVVGLDTLQIRNLTPSGAQDDAPAYSPDGARLAFTSGPGGGDRQIAVANADGSGRRALTERGANDNNPIWSPDGAWLAFSSNRGGAFFQVYIMRADGRDLRALTSGDGQKWNLSWKP